MSDPLPEHCSLGVLDVGVKLVVVAGEGGEHDDIRLRHRPAGAGDLLPDLELLKVAASGLKLPFPFSLHLLPPSKDSNWRKSVRRMQSTEAN